MRRRRRLRTVLLAAAATGLAMVAGYLNVPAASADVPAPYFASSANRADPHVITCTHPTTGVNGFCLYTSKDMGQSQAYPPANYYPMVETRVHWSPNGYSGWTDEGVAFHEDDISWVPNDAKHQWAPAAVKSGSYYYLYVPNVACTAHTGSCNIHNSSRIAVARSTNPFGPFDYQGYVPNSSGYMSDPEVFIEGSNRYLLWVDGDNGNCGGFRSAKLNSDMRTLVSGTTKELVINGLGVLGNCGGKGRPYVEGASLYKFSESSMPGPYTLIFPAKPSSTPAECTSSVTPSGSADTANSVIAYATATNPQGPFTYKGIIICGSTTEWTNQATIMKVTTPSGKKPWVIVYHDSPADIKERKLHAECLFAGGGKIAGVYRQALNAANGFDDCVDTVNFDYSGLWVRSPSQTHPTILSAPNAGNWDVRMNRYAVGPWERFDAIALSNGRVAYRALANGKYLCTPNSTTPLKASCSSTSSTSAQFVRVNVGNNEFLLQSAATGAYLGVCGTDYRLCASYAEQGTAWAARFTEMHLR